MRRLIQILEAEGVEHENTIVENVIARKTFAANELSVRKVFEGQCGVIVNDNNSTDTLTLGVRFGTTSATPASNTDCGRSAAIDSEDADQAIVLWQLHVQSLTRAVLFVELQAPDAKGTGAITRHMTVLTIAANTEYYLDVTADWSVAHADNEVAAAAFAVFESA
jgi:hypothetical protein